MKKLSNVLNESYGRNIVQESTTNTFLVDLQAKLIQPLTKKLNELNDKQEENVTPRQIEKEVWKLFNDIVTRLMWCVNDNDEIIGNIDITVKSQKNINTCDIEFQLKTIEGDKFDVGMYGSDRKNFNFEYISEIPRNLKNRKQGLDNSLVVSLRKKYERM